MRPSWIIKGHPFGFHLRAPLTSDTSFPDEYIWVDSNAVESYSLVSVSGGTAVWASRPPDYILNVNTDTPVYVIGETVLGEAQPGVPVVGPQGPQGTPGDVFLTGEVTGDVLRWNSVTQLWEAAHEPLEFTEIRLTPKSSSTGAEGTIFYNGDDNSVYVGTE